MPVHRSSTGRLLSPVAREGRGEMLGFLDAETGEPYLRARFTGLTAGERRERIRGAGGTAGGVVIHGGRFFFPLAWFVVNEPRRVGSMRGLQALLSDAAKDRR